MRPPFKDKGQSFIDCSPLMGISDFNTTTRIPVFATIILKFQESS
jgi:hypothetical protein